MLFHKTPLSLDYNLDIASEVITCSDQVIFIHVGHEISGLLVLRTYFFVFLLMVPRA